MQIDEKNNMPSGDAVNTQQENNFQLAAVSEQPTRPERSRQLSKPLKRLRTIPLANAQHSARERRQRVARMGSQQYGAAVWGSYEESAGSTSYNGSTVEAVVEQREFPGDEISEMFDMAAARENATSWQWIYEGGENGSANQDDLDASANAQGQPGALLYPQTGPIPIMLEPASRRGARERAPGSHVAASLLPLLVTLLIIGVVGALVCQYLLAFYR